MRRRLLTFRNRLFDVRGMRPRMVSTLRRVVDAGARNADRPADSLARTRRTPSSAQIARIERNLSERDFARSVDPRFRFACVTGVCQSAQDPGITTCA
jgi:hypothetical protein